MEEKIYFPNSKGDKLCGILSNPTGNKHQPLIILVHGFHSNKNTKSFVKLISILNANKILSFRFDIFGHGESEGKFEDLTISEAVDDILQAIKFIKQKGYKKIGLVGSSFGGISSIMAANKTPDLFVLGLKSPVSNYLERNKKIMSDKEIEEWRTKRFRIVDEYRLNYSFYEDFKNNDGYRAAPKIKIPTIIIHGDADESVPVEQSIKTAKLIPNCKLVLIKGADHTYKKEEHMNEMSSALADFIIKNLEY